ncbi:MAG: response regulator [Ruminiclostridium sp.]|nr:response regulator [Ruminiclostridium sp.]
MSVDILITDDSTVERNFISGLLKKLGAQPHLADCCKEGVRLACEQPFDLILIDYFMPGSDGVHTLREIRQKAAELNGNTPALALGVSDYESDSEFYASHGFVNYIEKPVDFDILHAALLLYLPEEKRGEICGSAEAATDGGQDSMLPGWLGDIPELSAEDGVKNCGSEEGYMSALEIFYKSIDRMSDEIEGYYNNGDLKNYTIKVHALKSSARIIGLAELSELAKGLEAAGDGGDVERIENETGGLLELYRSYKRKLSPLDGGADTGQEDDSDKPPADRDLLDDMFSSLDEFAAQMDYDSVEMVIESAKDYSLEPREKALLDEIDAAFLSLDWSAIRTAAQKYFS